MQSSQACVCPLDGDGVQRSGPREAEHGAVGWRVRIPIDVYCSRFRTGFLELAHLSYIERLQEISSAVVDFMQCLLENAKLFEKK